MSNPELDASLFSHPFMLHHDYEMFEEIIAKQTKSIFPPEDVIDARFHHIRDDLSVFGHTEQGKLYSIAETELSGLEIAYFFTDMFLTPDAAIAKDTRTYAEDLRERGVEDIEIIKAANRLRLTLKNRRGLREARLLVGVLVSEDQVRRDAEDYFVSVENSIG